jgi:hypothetical protein
VRGPYTEKTENNCQTKKLKSRNGPHWGPDTKTNWPTDRRSQYNLKLNLRHCTVNYRPIISSERAPYMKIEESNCHSKKCSSKRGKTPRRTGRLTVGRNISWCPYSKYMRVSRKKKKRVFKVTHIRLPIVRENLRWEGPVLLLARKFTGHHVISLHYLSRHMFLGLRVESMGGNRGTVAAAALRLQMTSNGSVCHLRIHWFLVRLILPPS